MSSNNGRNFLHHALHRIVGARGATTSQQPLGTRPSSGEATLPSSAPCTSFGNGSSMKARNFGKYFTVSDIAQHRLVYLGEIHSVLPIVGFQQSVAEEMKVQSAQKLHIVMEHFSFDMQGLLDDYQSGKISFEELLQKYDEVGSEQHNLKPYKAFLEYARREKDSILLHAGFLSRKYARMLMKEGEPTALERAMVWLPKNTTSLQGSDFHYNIFERLIRGAMPLVGSNGETGAVEPSSDRFRGIFQAQLLKDYAMAHHVQNLLEDNLSKDDKILVIAGNGHLQYGCGVPERVSSAAAESCLVLCLPVSSSDDKDMILNELCSMYGPEGSNPADFIFAYSEESTVADNDFIGVAVKAETAGTYDRVGESAHLKGNLAKAAAIMSALGYSTDEFDVAGVDAYNFQGVGNPHLHAQICPGDIVLDVGSGLGVDSFIANAATGQGGKVIGIDISAREVAYAQQRAKERGIGIRFVTADMESLPLPDNSVDVIISNGAFCLVPDKRKALSEMFRVLKPGGRISVCTSTILDANLEPGVSWPLCMQMFIPKASIKGLCGALGFVNIIVDDSDSSFSLDIPEEVMLQDEQERNPSRNRVHVGSPEFRHLEDFDLSKICARVCIVARKPGPPIEGENESQQP